MKWLVRNLKYFFREDFCYPKDFINDLNWNKVWESFKKNPLHVIFTVSLYIIIALILMIQYYVTLPFRLLSEISQWWCEEY